MSVYFITGATGAVGSAVVPQLLAQPALSAVLLVRAASAADLQRRLEALFAFWGLGPEHPWRSRVSAVAGDATADRLGLDPATHGALTEQVTHIVHSAGAVRMNLPLADAQHSASGSARQVLALARGCQARGRLHKVEVVSTVGVGGRLPEVPETWLTGPRAFHNTYEQAKADAEVLLRQALEQEGLPITVHRPSMVVGDSRTGRILHFQVFYHLCEFLSGRRTLGLFPPLHGGSLDIVPVDEVARLIAWSAQRPALVGAVLHACGGEHGRIGLVALRDEVRSAMATRAWPLPRVKPLPDAVFRGLLRLVGPALPGPVRKAVATLPIFLDYLATHQRFENHQTRQRLASDGQPDMPAWPGYIGAVLQHYVATSSPTPRA